MAGRNGAGGFSTTPTSNRYETIHATIDWLSKLGGRIMRKVKCSRLSEPTQRHSTDPAHNLTVTPTGFLGSAGTTEE